MAITITVLSNNPEKTKALHGTQAVTRYKGLLPALVQSDAVVSGGGGLLQDKTSARSLRYYLGILASRQGARQGGSCLWTGRRAAQPGRESAPCGARSAGIPCCGAEIARRSAASPR